MKSSPDKTGSLHYPLGKLPQDDLLSLLSNYNYQMDPRVIFGPGLGRDAAVIDFGDTYLVTKSDPITFATDQIGWYAVNVNANDIACMGAKPRWFLATLLLPEGKTDYALVESIFQQLHDASAALRVNIVGGHTEITHNIDRPIIVGAMFGEVTPDKFIRTDGASPGDSLILTKRICVEGTALLAREKSILLQHKIKPGLQEKAANFLFEPGISIVRDAAIATNAGEVHAMHDPTEGGIATGLFEMLGAAGYGAIIERDSLPYYPETLTLCSVLSLNPLGLIASGSLLAAVAAKDAQSVINALTNAGIQASIIGTVTENPEIFLYEEGINKPFPHFTRDEITRIYE